MKISYFQSVVCENCSKLEINYLHNLKASMKYYVLTQYVSGEAIQVSNHCTSIVEQILQVCTFRATAELQPLMSTDFTPNTFSRTINGC